MPAFLIDHGDTDDGCAHYLHTCCGETSEGRTPPGAYCTYCGAKFARTIDGRVVRPRTARARLRAYRLLKDGEDTGLLFMNRENAAKAIRIARQYRDWRWYWTLDALRQDELEDALEDWRESSLPEPVFQFRIDYI